MSTMHDRSPELRRADGGRIRVLVVDDEATLSKPAVHRAQDDRRRPSLMIHTTRGAGHVLTPAADG
jgi:hypothetical protein